jgi:hypothetical protein
VEPVPVALDTELADLLDEVAEERDRVLVARYLGWGGQGIRTFQLVADDFEMTRERVRQICSRVGNALKGMHPYTPTLDRVLNSIEQQMPAPVADIESRLNTSGLTTNAFRLEGIINAAAVFGRAVDISIQNTAAGRIALPAKCVEVARRMLQVARQGVRQRGAVTISDIVGKLRNFGSLSREQFVVKTLGTQRDFQWLDTSGGWFWFFPTTDNRILLRIEKILAVANRIAVSELHQQSPLIGD